MLLIAGVILLAIGYAAPASTLSHHLKRLVDAGVMQTRGEGTFHYYSADYDALRKLTAYLWEDCCKKGSKGACC